MASAYPPAATGSPSVERYQPSSLSGPAHREHGHCSWELHRVRPTGQSSRRCADRPREHALHKHPRTPRGGHHTADRAAGVLRPRRNPPAVYLARRARDRPALVGAPGPSHPAFLCRRWCALNETVAPGEKEVPRGNRGGRGCASPSPLKQPRRTNSRRGRFHEHGAVSRASRHVLNAAAHGRKRRSRRLAPLRRTPR